MLGKTISLKSLIVSTLLVSLVALASNVWAQTTEDIPPPLVCGEPTEVILYAGQTIESGTVTVWNDDTNLYVRFQTIDGWMMKETHLAVANSLEEIPMNGAGNPQIGLFPYQTAHEPYVDDFTYTIFLADAGFEVGDELFVAAHAAVILFDEEGNPIQEETGWGDGPGFPGHSWAMYFNFEVQPCEPPPPPPDIEVGDFRTQTQGGWGTVANGNNPGTYRDANFAYAFPEGLVVGGYYNILFKSSLAVQNFLPQGGTANVLSNSYINPWETEAGVLAGQMTALALNVGFDYYDPDFGASAFNLADLVVVDEHSVCYGMTVQEVLNAGNMVIGGDTTTFMPSEMNDCAAGINENFVDGAMVGTFLGLP